MQKEAIIGVIGGMGPYAGLDLVRKIFDQTDANADQEHLPVALLSYPSTIPDRSAFLLGRSSASPIEPIAEMAEALARLGARAIGIPCNTAHAAPIFDEVTRRLAASGKEVVLLHLIEETVRYIREELRSLGRVGVLSTLAVYRLGLYRERIQAAGLEAVVPDERVQLDLVSTAIYDPGYGIKAQSNPVSSQARQNLLTAAGHLREKGAQAIILGCTELVLALPEPEIDGIPLIDPAVVLARALIRGTNPDRLKRL
jgi:aspartate racemase